VKKDARCITKEPITRDREELRERVIGKKKKFQGANRGGAVEIRGS